MAASEPTNRMLALVQDVRDSKRRLSSAALGIAETDVLSVIPSVLRETMAVTVRIRDRVAPSALEMRLQVFLTPKAAEDGTRVELQFQQHVGFKLDEDTPRYSLFSNRDVMHVSLRPLGECMCALGSVFNEQVLRQEACKLPTEVIRALEAAQTAFQCLGEYWAGHSANYRTTEEIRRAAERHEPTIVIKKPRTRTVEEVYWAAEEKEPAGKRARTEE